MPAPDLTTDSPLLEVRELRKHYPIEVGLLRRTIGHVQAVDGVDLTIGVGETLGLVGESGSGKSTLGRLILGLVEPSDGQVCFGGTDMAVLNSEQVRLLRSSMQLVFQDPLSSFDPQSTVGESVAEPLVTHRPAMKGAERRARVEELFGEVGLPAYFFDRYPSQLSGGQLQRAGLARALALDPKLLVLDEPVSALDLSTQAQVINLLRDLQRRLGVAYLMIAHDLSVVRHISHRIAVMYLGRIVEVGPGDEVAENPLHPYTAALLSAVPVPDPVVQRGRNRIVLEGDVPSPADPPSGCRFHTRCPFAMDVCAIVDPEPFTSDSGTTVFCHLHTSSPEAGDVSRRASSS